MSYDTNIISMHLTTDDYENKKVDQAAFVLSLVEEKNKSYIIWDIKEKIKRYFVNQIRLKIVSLHYSKTKNKSVSVNFNNRIQLKIYSILKPSYFNWWLRNLSRKEEKLKNKLECNRSDYYRFKIMISLILWN